MPLSALDDFPLEDDQLEEIAGGGSAAKALCVNTVKLKA